MNVSLPLPVAPLDTVAYRPVLNHENLGTWLALLNVLAYAPRGEGEDRLATQNQRLRRRLRVARRQARRLARLRAFLSPAVADLVLSRSDAELLRRERREVTVVFLDLRGFTGFTQRAEPEEVEQLLGEFHAEVGRLTDVFGGTIERFMGDGIMILFNAPVPMPNAPDAAVQLALAIRARFAQLADLWNLRGHELDLGIGIAHGFATVGIIGYEGRRDYAAIGNVTNFAARLCAEARDRRILASLALVNALGERVDAEPLGQLVLKGFVKPVHAFDVRGLRPADAPALPAAGEAPAPLVAVEVS